MATASVVLRTNGPQTGTTSTNTSRTITIDHTEHMRLITRIKAENPSTGAFQGSAEVVLEELDASGAVTQTVVGTLSSHGELKIKKVVYATGTTGLPGGSLLWLSTTQQARILVRFAGATKNLTIKIRYRRLISGAHEPRHRKRTPPVVDPPPIVVDPGDPGDPGVDPEDPDDDTELPPGDDVGVDVPPEEPPLPVPIPGVSPSLVVWADPDRPSGTGIALETKHTFETALPPGWTQVTTGATLTRVSGSVLTGTYSMRSYKATP